MARPPPASRTGAAPDLAARCCGGGAGGRAERSGSAVEPGPRETPPATRPEDTRC